MSEEIKSRTEKNFFLSLFILVLILFAALGFLNTTTNTQQEKTNNIEATIKVTLGPEAVRIIIETLYKIPPIQARVTAPFL